MRKTLVACVVVLLLSGTNVAEADTLRLLNGSAIQGTLLGADPRQIRFMSSSGSVRAYPVTAVAAIEFGAPAAQSVAAPASTALAPRPAAAPGAPGVIVPAGTKFTVRLIDAVDSTKTAVGERFRASIDDPIVVSNQVAIPRGADALVQLVQAEGSNEVFLKLYSVTVAGNAYDVVSDYAQFKKKSRRRKRARRAVGLGAIGAGIGAIADGGSGAAIGGAAGAGLGAISAGKVKIQLPPETRVSFDLRAPLPLT